MDNPDYDPERVAVWNERLRAHFNTTRITVVQTYALDIA